jgi:hypothetical protein
VQGHAVAAAVAAAAAPAFSRVLFVFLTIDGVKVLRTSFYRSGLSLVETVEKSLQL